MKGSTKFFLLLGFNFVFFTGMTILVIRSKVISINKEIDTIEFEMKQNANCTILIVEEKHQKFTMKVSVQIQEVNKGDYLSYEYWTNRQTLFIRKEELAKGNIFTCHYYEKEDSYFSKNQIKWFINGLELSKFNTYFFWILTCLVFTMLVSLLAYEGLMKNKNHLEYEEMNFEVLTK